MNVRPVLFIKVCFAALLLGLTCQCKRSHVSDSVTSDLLPPAPKYSDTSQWYVTDRQGEADLFYVISTETGDYTFTDGKEYHFANTYNDSLRGPLHGEMLGVDTLLSGRLNFYAPYYRQCSLQTFMSDSTTQSRMPIATEDVRNAFNYYLAHLNQGRPFILAGFSQGAMIVLELIKEMDEATLGKMIAAYTLGTTITQPMIDANRHLVGAKGADDTGVTICYNSVRDASCAMSKERSAIAINPVNWRTDSAVAVFSTQPSPLLPVDQQKEDLLKVHLDPATHLLFVEGYTATDYVLPLIGKEGNYHSREIWLYRKQLRENMGLRTAAFLSK